MFVPERLGGFRNESVKIRVIPNWNHFKIRLVIDPKGQLKKWEKKPRISEQIKRPEGLFYFYLRGFHDLVSPNGMLHANFFQSCPTLCDPMDCSLPGSSVHEIFQARILEWVAISSSRGSSSLRYRTHVSCVFWIERQILYHCTAWEA